MLNLRQSNRTALLDPSCKSEETLTSPNSLHCSLPLEHLRTSLLANYGTPANTTVYKLDHVHLMTISLLNNIFQQVLISYFSWFVSIIDIFILLRLFLRVFVFGNMLQIDLFVRLTWLHGIKWPLNCLYAVAPSDILLQEAVAIWGLNWQIYSECLHNTAWL